MKPITIDLRMRQNVSEESKKAVSSIRTLDNEAKIAQDELKESIAIQKKVLADLRTELVGLEKDFKKVNVGTHDPEISKEKARLSKMVRGLITEIKLEEEALGMLEKQQEVYALKTKNLGTEINKVRDEMAALKLQGRDNSKEYKMLEERLGLLGTAYRELSETQKQLSAHSMHLDGVLSGLQGIAGAFAASAGMMGLFNTNSKDMEKIQKRLQAAISLTIGLQQISNTLKETSAFRTATVSKAKELWAKANIKVAGALGITNIQARLLMGTLSLGLSVAITAVLYLLDKYISKKQKTAKVAKEFTDTVTKSSAKVIARYKKMRKEWDALGDSMAKKKRYVIDNQKAFNKLGIAIRGVAEAEAFIYNGTGNFIKSQIARAKVAAKVNEAQKTELN